MSQLTIRIRDNGPLVVETPVTVVDAEGKAFTLSTEKPVVALCRCGASAKKPFCDGAHKNCNFDSAPRAT